MGVLFGMLHDGTFHEPRTTGTATADHMCLINSLSHPSADHRREWFLSGEKAPRPRLRDGGRIRDVNEVIEAG
jgi:hypothetical protein